MPLPSESSQLEAAGSFPSAAFCVFVGFPRQGHLFSFLRKLSTDNFHHTLSQLGKEPKLRCFRLWSVESGFGESRCPGLDIQP